LKLVTKVTSNGLKTVTADRHGRATDDLEDLILKEEDGGACTQDGLPGSHSHIPVKVGRDSINIIVGRYLEGAEATRSEFLLSAQKREEG
jgi:hypothetical protein